MEYFSIMLAALAACLAVSIHPMFCPIFIFSMIVYRRSRKMIRLRDDAVDDSEVLADRIKLSQEKHGQILMTRWRELVEEWPGGKEYFGSEEFLKNFS